MIPCGEGARAEGGVYRQTTEGIDKIVMQLYCTRNKRVDTEGMEHLSTPVKYISVADFLEKYPKFGGLAAEGSRSATESDRKRDAVEIVDSDGEGRVSDRWPCGAKSVEKDMDVKRIMDLVVEKMEDISDCLGRSIVALEPIAETQERGLDQDGDYILLQFLPRGTPE